MTTGAEGPEGADVTEVIGAGNDPPPTQHTTLKYSLLGPSLLKAGQDSVDQSKVRVSPLAW